MKRVLILLFFGMLLTGCYTSSLTVVGPATGVASGKISETAASTSLNYVVKKRTGITPIEHVLSESQIKTLEQNKAKNDLFNTLLVSYFDKPKSVILISKLVCSRSTFLRKLVFWYGSMSNKS